MVFVVPGNAGTATEEGLENIELDPMDFQALSKFCKEHDVELSIVGPEAPLVAGIVDHFQREGLACFGPSQGAAQLEGSKALPRILQRHHIPTAACSSLHRTAMLPLTISTEQSMPS